ncbi:MAG: hypothetical protein ABSB67_23430, partial [Bryobacteraceae bacterium]
PREVEKRAIRTLPRTVVSELHVLPFRVQEGALLVATARAPGETVIAALNGYTRLRVVFHLTTTSNFQELRQAFG